MTTPTSCPKCGNTHLNKQGFRHRAAGPVQRWLCDEGHYFTGQEKFHHATPEQKQLATALESEGLSVRGIARTVGVYPNAVKAWLQKKE